MIEIIKDLDIQDWSKLSITAEVKLKEGSLIKWHWKFESMTTGELLKIASKMIWAKIKKWWANRHAKK